MVLFPISITSCRLSILRNGCVILSCLRVRSPSLAGRSVVVGLEVGGGGAGGWQVEMWKEVEKEGSKGIVTCYRWKRMVRILPY